MALVKPRTPVKFSSLDGATNITFPRVEYGWQSSQALRNALEVAVGANYAVDLLGDARAARGIATEQVTFEVLDKGSGYDTVIDNLRAGIYMLGRGKLWQQDSSGVDWWAYARLAEVPGSDINIDNRLAPPMTLSFVRLSDWYASSQTTVSEDIDSTSVDVSVTNAGSLEVANAIITITANAASGFNGMTVESQSNGNKFTINRDGANGSVFRIDCGRRLVQYASDGVTFVSDYGNFSWGNTQVDFMTLVTGSQTLRVTQSTTPNATFEIEFYAPYM